MAPLLAPAHSTPLLPGAVLKDRYQVECFLDAGGVSIVHKGIDLQTGLPVALKTLQQAPEPDYSRHRRHLLREAEILRSIEEGGVPGVVRLLDCAEHVSGTVLVLEYLDGPTLAKLLETPGRRGGILWALDLLDSLAETLDGFHRLGIVHRDIKGKNLLLPRDSRPVVIDFAEGREVLHTMTVGAPMGTYRYFAPERFLEAGPGDWRVDLFALGVGAYELLAGRTPWSGQSSERIYTEICFQERTPASQIYEKVKGSRAPWGSSFDQVLQRSIAIDPEDRWTSCSEFVRKLQESFANPDPTTPLSFPEEKSRWRLALKTMLRDIAGML